MATPQAGIFVEGTSNHWFQEYDISRSADTTAIKAALLDAARGAAEKSGQPGSGQREGVQIVVGLGASLANQLGLELPSDFRPYESIGSGAKAALSTPHDLFVWIHGNDQGLIFDAALKARRALTQVGAIVADVPAFVYLDNRDLTGFIDGTENPEAEEGRQLAVVGDDLSGAGGSTVLVQRWVHDLDGFHALDVVEQERIIGRTKPDSVELAEDVLPENSHVARVVMEDDAGEEIEIYRRSVPWGDSTEAGLMFVAFTDERAKIDNMVRSMFGLAADEGTDGDGIHDRLTDFSAVRTSSYFFAPSQEALVGFGQP